MKGPIDKVESFVPIFEQMRLPITKKAVEELVIRARKDGSVPQEMIQAVFDLYISELSKDRPDHYLASASLRSNLENISSRYSVMEHDKLPAFEFVDDVDDEQAGYIRGTILRNLSDPNIGNEAATFLVGYAIITRYEIETQKVRSLLIRNLRVYHDIKRWEIESTIQGFFTRNRDYHLAPELKEDYRSEICHIRNAFAHSHVRFVNDDQIELWDRFRNRNGHYIETFQENILHKGTCSRI